MFRAFGSREVVRIDSGHACILPLENVLFIRSERSIVGQVDCFPKDNSFVAHEDKFATIGSATCYRRNVKSAVNLMSTLR